MSGKKFYTLHELRHWEDFAPQFDPPARLAVIGDPVAHSRSPQMHNAALTDRGINAQYIRVQIPAGSVAESLGLFARHGFIGVNCTIPHKFEALAAVEELDPLAETLGAVNTVAFRNGRLFGFNSDGPGFVKSAEEAFGIPLAGLRVLVIGAGGGAGQAVSLQCAISGCAEIVLVNRTVEKLQPLADACRRVSPAVSVKAIAFTPEALANAVPQVDLIVNATSLGMAGDESTVVEPSLLRANHLVYDMVYRAKGHTPLIGAAAERGARTCDGLVLLLHQGGVSFAHWFGSPAPLAAMRQGLLEG